MGVWVGHILLRNCFLKHVIKKNRGKDKNDGKMRVKT
jgi:hypothetical protein